MGLINLLTDLTSFQYYASKGYPGDGSKTGMKSIPQGHDRRGGGSSNQPYITTPIPEKLGEFGYLNQDFILRGGSKALTDSALDVVRLGKYFTDLKNPSGLLFTVKQNLLSRMAVRTQASTGLLNEGTYTPLSTLAEAGGVAFGLHINKQGLNPFNGIGGIVKYEDAVIHDINILSATTTVTGTTYVSDGRGGKTASTQKTKVKPSIEPVNRLVELWGSKIGNNKGDQNVVLVYKGGPGSILGIGDTRIRFATGNGVNDVRTGLNNDNYGKRENYQAKGYESSEEIYYDVSDQRLFELASRWYTQKYNIPIDNKLILSSVTSSITGNGSNYYYSINSGILNPNINNKSVTFNTEQLAQTSTSGSAGESQYIGNINGINSVTTPGDFRKNLRRGNPSLQESQEEVGNLINAPEYNGVNAKNIEKRLFLGDPGNRTLKKLTSYTNGFDGTGAASPTSYDLINASKMESNGKFQDDLVKFGIEIINNDTPSNTINLQFRAFLNQISDGYSADWNATKYIGRGENFYTYGGFDRKVSLSWTVAAQSKAELIPMYKKLNYLASVITPDYSSNGYMRGNLVKLTIGGYFYQQPGIITGFSYEMNDDNATWEIGIDDTGNTDDSVKQLPHLIKVSGFNFIPIHDFVPKRVPINFANGDTTQRYIALANGPGLESTNYNT